MSLVRRRARARPRATAPFPPFPTSPRFRVALPPIPPAAKDEWDFEFLGMSNHPFIKANYPHHEGIWGWDDAADQVVMMIKNMRGSMVECE